MHRGLFSLLVFTACATVALGLRTSAQSATPYKLGTFAQGDRTFIGLVLNDSLVLDLPAANQVFEKQNASASKVSIPTDMKQLIAAYETGGIKARLAAIAAAASQSRPAAALDVKSLKTLPPVMPQNILNAAVNYTEHEKEMAGRSTQSGATAPPAKPPDSIPGIWARKPGDTRQNPY